MNTQADATHTPRTLAVDIGNTRVHLGIISLKGFSCHASAAFPISEIRTGLNRELSRLQDDIEQLPATAVVASVVSSAAAEAFSLLTAEGITPYRLTDRQNLPFSIDYNPVESLGVDRIANALCMHTLYPGQPVIIICMGTAITIDLLDGDHYRGGVILPGLQLQLNALSGNTDALPARRLPKNIFSPEIPAQSTDAGMTAGVVAGTAGAVSNIVGTYRKYFTSENVRIIGTGGDWQHCAPYVSFTAATHPDATLVGTGLLLPYCTAYTSE
jgi:type III pantothenate kinase